jgi:hypothetical protein
MVGGMGFVLEEVVSGEYGTEGLRSVSVLLSPSVL